MEKLDKWKCPICNGDMIIDPFANPSGKKPGFKLTCKGVVGQRHRMRVFVEDFDADASFLPAVSTREVLIRERKSRAEELLERAARLAEAA